MIVITNPSSIENEFLIIHQLFEEGLGLLHVRKPIYSENEMRNFLSNIDIKFHSKLVLHDHHNLTNEFAINRIHFKEKDRVEISDNFQKTVSYLSTSVHNINDFNELFIYFDVAFMSPVFESISKEGYGKNSTILETIVNRTNFHTELVALGGLHESNIKKALDSGFDTVALLGSIWLNDNPIKNFKQCQKIVHTY